MYAFTPLPFRPVSRPFVGQAITAQAPPPAATPSQIKTISTVFGIAGIGLNAAIAVVGYNAGMTEQGWLKYLGWIAAVAGTASGLFQALKMAKVLGATPAELQKMFPGSLQTHVAEGGVQNG